MSVLVLGEDDVRATLDMPRCIEAMEGVLAALAREEVSMPLRTITDSSARHSAAAPRIDVAASSVSWRASAGVARLNGSHTAMCTTTCGLNDVIRSTMRP